jgi:hypothetical protein
MLTAALDRRSAMRQPRNRALYTADIPLEAIVHAAIVYSTIANGRTVSRHCSR